MITTCTDCGRNYEAPGDEAAGEPDRSCRLCIIGHGGRPRPPYSAEDVAAFEMRARLAERVAARAEARLRTTLHRGGLHTLQKSEDATRAKRETATRRRATADWAAARGPEAAR